MIIAQISDLHVAVDNSEADAVQQGAAGLERAVAHLNALEPRPELVVASGARLQVAGIDCFRNSIPLGSKASGNALIVTARRSSRGERRSMVVTPSTPIFATRSKPRRSSLPKSSAFLWRR